MRLPCLAGQDKSPLVRVWICIYTTWIPLAPRLGPSVCPVAPTESQSPQLACGQPRGCTLLQVLLQTITATQLARTFQVPLLCSRELLLLPHHDHLDIRANGSAGAGLERLGQGDCSSGVLDLGSRLPLCVLVLLCTSRIKLLMGWWLLWWASK